ncbi:NAD(+) synthase [Bengtsoniella intestinalis]|uniref:NAD(+) synthase n=1 Tax=Bengtsoniella intestinalis TaxID=3073143 RepID=UPI00391F027B
MNHGFVAVGCATPPMHLANCQENARESFELMRKADSAGVKVLVLPELGLTGYTCGDLFYQDTLLQGAIDGLDTVLQATKHLDVVTCIGLPLQHKGKLYNVCAVIQKGRILGLVPKTHLPNYSEFYEKRHFTPAFAGLETVELLGQSVPFGTGITFACKDLPALVLGVELCEDLWAPISPSLHLACAGATVICNQSASNDIIGKEPYRRQLIAMQSAKLLCGYIYTSAGEGESTSDVVFGAHQVVAENGTILHQSRYDQGLHITEIDVARLVYERRRTQLLPTEQASITIPFSLPMTKTALTRYVAAQPFVPQGKEHRNQRCHEILMTASLGLKQRLIHTHAATAVVGLSGGLDSTLAILITALAFQMMGKPMEEIIAVTMPCFGTTNRTKSNAVVLAEQLGATLRTVDISSSVRSHFKDIGHNMDDHSVTFENGQARERTQVLMDVANQTGGIVIGTGDLSELALGWCTYNGDHMSMYAVNTSIPKTLVRHLVDYLAQDKRQTHLALTTVLEDILDTPVSPELLPAVNGEIAQITEDLVGPYELHDFYLYYLLRWGFAPSKILRLAEYALGNVYSRDVMVKWIKVFYRRFFSQQFKRNCLPDGPKVGSVALSPRGDWRMPSDAQSRLWLEEAEAL